MESFWGALKNELVHHRRFATRQQAIVAIVGHQAAALRMGGGGEDEALVILQNLGGDIGGVILADFRSDTEIGAKKGRPYLGHQFLFRVTVIAPALAAEVTLQSGRGFRPMAHLMAKGPVKGFGVIESEEGRHLHMIGEPAA